MQHLFINGHIFTADRQNRIVDSMLIEDETIVFAGEEAAARKKAHSHAAVTDLQGTFVSPGFIDAHQHLVLSGLYLNAVQLGDANTPETFVQRIADYASQLPEGQWICYGAWDHENWGGPLPDKSWIDAVTPRNPVWVTRLDGHTGLANSLALEKAGITEATKAPEGGAIEKDDDGNPTGIIRDNAMTLIEKHIPAVTQEEQEAGLQKATDYLHSLGITSVHHMNLFEESDLDFLDRMHAARKLRLRIYATYPLQDWHALASRISMEGSGDEWLRVGGLKGFADGSLGSRTAAFLEPYTDEPENSGLLTTSQKALYELAEIADMHHLQVNIHAIGDRAVRILLDNLEKIQEKHGIRDHRFRIEHAQHIHADDIPRFAKLGVIASMQPIHLKYDGRWAHQAVGQARMKDAYPLRSLLDHGAKLAFGSDWFVATPDPVQGIFLAVTRFAGDPEDQQAVVSEERITPAEALRAYTIDAASASFEENLKGSLEAGKLADFVILSDNPLKAAPKDIRHICALQTWIAGQKAFDRSS